MGEKDIEVLVSPLHQCVQLKEEMQTGSSYNFLNIRTMSLPQSTVMKKKRDGEGKILEILLSKQHQTSGRSWSEKTRKEQMVKMLQT